MALHAVFPELDLEEDAGSGVGRLSYPRPISEPPSPTSSRATTPIPSDQSDDESDGIDEEREVWPMINCSCFSYFDNLLYCIFNIAASRTWCKRR